MKNARLGSAILNQTSLDWEHNKNNIIQCIQEAKENQVDILCLPELCISGYGCEDAFLSNTTFYNSVRSLVEIKEYCDNITVNVGLPVIYAGCVYNTTCIISNKVILGFVAKKHLCNDGIHYEARWFKPWKDGEIITTNFECPMLDEVPFGDIVFNINGIKIGFEICEDAWVSDRPGINLSKKGVDLILNPSASHFAFNKYQIREGLVVEGSRSFGLTYVYSNLVGNESGRVIYDGGALIASNGKIIKRGPRFIFEDYHITIVDVDLSLPKMKKLANHNYIPDIKHEESIVKFVNIDMLRDAFNKKEIALETYEHVNINPRMSKNDEFTEAVALGLFDYMRKTKSNGFVVSLSGGVDSSAVVVLVYLMVVLGIKKTWKKHEKSDCETSEFLTKISYIKDLDIDNFINKQPDMLYKKIVNKLLTTVYQGTINSSDDTRNAAKILSTSIGANHVEFNIDEIIDKYKEIGKLINVDLTGEWNKDYDLALQNIQARTRAPGVWLLANLKNALLLTTSNRSEAAVGYATLDGDTCGGLAPIAGIDKHFLIQWLLNYVPAHFTGPNIEAGVHAVPTAELRPKEMTQTDEQDLMPYVILNRIEKLAIIDKYSPGNVVYFLTKEFPDYSKLELQNFVEKFYTLWCRNQFKRERYAPGFHLDDQNLDPKTNCRFPILNGGFKREIEIMKNPEEYL